MVKMKFKIISLKHVESCEEQTPNYMMKVFKLNKHFLF